MSTGIFFRAERNGKFQPVELEELNPQERAAAMAKFDRDGLLRTIDIIIDDKIDFDPKGHGAIWDAVQKLSPWHESNDMPWCDEILCGLSGALRDKEETGKEVERLKTEVKNLSQRNNEVRLERDLFKTYWAEASDKLHATSAECEKVKEALAVATIHMDAMASLLTEKIREVDNYRAMIQRGGLT